MCTVMCGDMCIGKSMVRIFAGPVVVVGRENLPEADGCLFVMNHQSQLDIGAAYYLDRHFSWISKKVSANASAIFLLKNGQCHR